MTDLLIALGYTAVGTALGIGAYAVWARRRAKSDSTPQSPLYALADRVDPFFQQAAQPADLIAHPTFIEGVAMLAGDAYTTGDRIGYAKGSNDVIACLALAALHDRDPGEGEDPTEGLLEGIDGAWGTRRFFLLRALGRRGTAPVVSRVLRKLDDTWEDDGETLVLQLIRDRIAADEAPSFDGLDSTDEDDIAWMQKFLARVDRELGIDLAQGFDRWGQSRLDVDFLNGVGHVIQRPPADPPIRVATDALAERVRLLRDSLSAATPRSVLLVGDEGTGKRTAIAQLIEELAADDWTVFVASGLDLMADQVYIGQLEGRLQRLIRTLEKRPKVVWFVPGFQELVYTGRHKFQQVSVLDTILPLVERGDLKIVGAVTPTAFERVAQSKPRAKLAFEALRVPALDDDATLALARAWTAKVGEADGTPLLDDPVLVEAFALVRQYLGDKANPGGLLDFLGRLREMRTTGVFPRDAALGLDGVMRALTRLTGLPATVIDDRTALDVTALEAFFHARVMGQPEAVTCLVERVAMVKAGLTDPTRPTGVFLFTGPTGTGKTEIAKTLADYLFGSPDRMIRLDMSEFQTADAHERLLGESDGPARGTALVDQIRKQPFAVLLLDEFEKAHAQVWDLFLQVFDDGRLTDRRGNTADFRHAIIILTANVGAESPAGAPIGFGDATAGAFDAESTARSLARVFRKEFLNRLDRVVTFRPLSRVVMREVLEKELARVLERRGLRHRQWAVEFDASALEFLLDRGFSPEFGARPLKRAIERYLLSPLALTIVNHRVPDGDQFLFVRADGDRIAVDFIDPDAPDDEPAPADDESDSGPADAERSAASIALAPSGDREDVVALDAALARLDAVVATDAWRDRKAAALDRVSDPDFWQSAERFTVLGRAEYMDRIEAGMKTARSLLRRLDGDGGAREHYPADLVGTLAQRLFLLDEALADPDGPQDAFVAVEATRDSKSDPAACDTTARRVVAMLTRWADKRRMALEPIDERPGDARTPYRFVGTVSGFAAWRVLAREHGLHVFADGEVRHRVRVVVAAQPPHPLADDAAVRDAAHAALDAATDATPQVVRRYREAPSPLVRDARGWRTGRIDRVLDGDFDLFGR